MSAGKGTPADTVTRLVRKLPALKVAFREGFAMGMRECCGREYPDSLVEECWQEFIRATLSERKS